MPKKTQDPEATAMQTVALVLAPLSDAEKQRVARWVYDRYVATVALPPVKLEATE